MDLKHRELKMQEARKDTPWRDFVKEICSWRPIVFYKNNGYVSRYPETNRQQKIISINDFDKERDDFVKHGINFNYSTGFFQNMKNLFSIVPFSSTIQMLGTENSGYADMVLGSKNIYLSVISVYGCENILYSFATRENTKNTLNSVMIFENSENVYFSSGIIKGHNIFYSKFIINSSNIWFSNNLIGCNDCIFCSGLENQSFCFQNEQLSKEDFMIKKNHLLKQKNAFLNSYIKNNSIGQNYGSNNVEGNFVVNSEDVQNTLFSYNMKQSRNILFGGGENGDTNFYDVCVGGAVQGDEVLGVQGVGNSQKVYNSIIVGSSSNIYYSYNLESCSYCLGCIGLKNKSFCILNKQYSKEERFEKANEIFAQMEKDGQLGKFFPASMNPFYFNDTVAYLIDDSFTREEVIADGYLWRDEEIKVDIPDGSQVVKNTELNQYQGFDSDGNRTIDPEILEKVIVDEKGNAYRIIKMEYDFLMRYGLPLPKLHRLDRIKLGFKFK